MTQPTSSHFVHPPVDPKALLGLADPCGGDWGTIRAAQVNAASSSALLRFSIGIFAAVLVVLIYSGIAPLWSLLGWLAAMVVVSLAITMRGIQRSRAPLRSASLRELRPVVHEAALLAIVWALVLPLSATAGSVQRLLALALVMAMLMTAHAVALASVPLATIVFVGILGAAVTVPLALSAMPQAALAMVVLTLVVAYGCFVRGRALVLVRTAELALGERDETVSLLLREFEENGADWLWQTDAARCVVHASPRFAFALGSQAETVNGKPLLQLLAGPAWETGNFAPGLRSLAGKLKSREPFRDLLLPVRVGEDDRWWEISASPRFDEHGVFCGFRGVGSDVTESRRSSDKINRMARFDTLTGLPNRLMINETLAHAMQAADQWNNRCAFMMIDLDRFKAINDTLGHPVGDRLLGRVAERLGRIMTENEMVGRLGGDEFAVVVRDANDPAKLEQLARLIIDTISRPYEVDQHTLYIGASLGVALSPRDGRTAEMLIRSADLALYRSKDAGGGVFHAYEPHLHVQAEERRVLEIALRQALDNGELHLNYQPVVAADDGTIEGFEALLRWTHPTFGNVSPDKFIPIAEDARLIAPIGEWVLRTACAEAAKWPSSTRIAVNVSPEQLYDPGFVNTVVSALAHGGLPAHRLELEVTESVFMREGSGAVQTLERILDLGVKLSLDDFGTGYSSLGYLSRTRFSTIKVDRSFVQGASKNVPECIAIIRAVVALARSLGMATTAEGVETETEYEMIKGFGVSKVQGYYFGRPLPTLEARALVTRPSPNERAVA